jgi:hypothetical protein
MLRGLLLVCLFVTTAHAEKFDATGWTLLGTQRVKGDHDRDAIGVGNQGKFDELRLVVQDADIELKTLTVVFSNGQRWIAPLKHSFKEGFRSAPIDLPGNDRAIAKLEMVYAAARPGDMAEVSVYGRDRRASGGAAPAAKPASGGGFDAKGWTKLGTGVVNGARDHDVIKVGTKKGGFDQITMVVEDADMQLDDLSIVFTNGKKWSPQLKHMFKEGSRSRSIDLPGKDRTIARVELAYANFAGRGKAKVEIYARDIGRPGPPKPTPVTWEKRGWTFLGKATVDGWKDRDRVAVRRPQPFSELMFVVAGSDVRLDKVTVTLGNNEKFEVHKNHAFKEGARIAPIDIPGTLRKIKSVDFAYTNLPGGGKAIVEVWGRATKR